MEQKINSVTSAETKDDSITIADVTTSSPNNAKPNVGRSFSSIINKYVRNGESKFQLQYFDYEKDQWTLPVLLTATRAINFQNDSSVKKVRIIWRSVSFEIDTF